jgi:N-acetylmuramic acid 6-phosphate etherase
MTNMRSSNDKLNERSVRILTAETKSSDNLAGELLKAAGGDLRVAIVMSKTGADREQAETLLREASFVIEKAIEQGSK